MTKPPFRVWKSYLIEARTWGKVEVGRWSSATTFLASSAFEVWLG